MTRARLLCIVAALIASVTTPGTLRSGEFRYTVRAGESASSIAKRYYGDFERTELLLLYNGKSGNLIREGEVLRVPYCELHSIEAGDTWSGLSRRYLGRASAYPVIAALNDLEPSRSLTIGREITMPVVLDHELARGESLAGLAERFYGDPSWADALIRFNEIDDPRRLPVGAVVRIPLASMQLVAPPIRDPAPQVAEPPEEPSARFGGELHRAHMAFAGGDFESTRAMLQTIDEAVEQKGLDSERAELWRLLAFVHVAYDEPDEACASYARLHGQDSARIDLDPDLISPKIRETLSGCSGDSSTGASK